jgi:HEAT repeat protein
MSSDKIEEQVEGIRMLGTGSAGKSAIPELMDLLGSDKAELRAAAAGTLTTLEAAEAADKFLELVESETDAAVRYGYLQGILTLKGKEAGAAACKPLLSSDDTAKQQTATALLASSMVPSGPVPVTELIPLASSEDSSIRTNVAAALGCTHPSSPDAAAAIATLKKMLKDGDASVKDAAYAALTAQSELELE